MKRLIVAFLTIGLFLQLETSSSASSTPFAKFMSKDAVSEYYAKNGIYVQSDGGLQYKDKVFSPQTSAYLSQTDSPSYNANFIKGFSNENPALVGLNSVDTKQAWEGYVKGVEAGISKYGSASYEGNPALPEIARNGGYVPVDGYLGSDAAFKINKNGTLQKVDPLDLLEQRLAPLPKEDTAAGSSAATDKQYLNTRWEEGWTDGYRGNLNGPLSFDNGLTNTPGDLARDSGYEKGKARFMSDLDSGLVREWSDRYKNYQQSKEYNIERDPIAQEKKAQQDQQDQQEAASREFNKAFEERRNAEINEPGKVARENLERQVYQDTQQAQKGWDKDSLGYPSYTPEEAAQRKQEAAQRKQQLQEEYAKDREAEWAKTTAKMAEERQLQETIEGTAPIADKNSSPTTSSPTTAADIGQKSTPPEAVPAGNPQTSALPTQLHPLSYEKESQPSHIPSDPASINDTAKGLTKDTSKDNDTTTSSTGYAVPVDDNSNLTPYNFGYQEGLQAIKEERKYKAPDLGDYPKEVRDAYQEGFKDAYKHSGLDPTENENNKDVADTTTSTPVEGNKEDVADTTTTTPVEGNKEDVADTTTSTPVEGNEGIADDITSTPVTPVEGNDDEYRPQTFYDYYSSYLKDSGSTPAGYDDYSSHFNNNDGYPSDSGGGYGIRDDLLVDSGYPEGGYGGGSE